MDQGPKAMRGAQPELGGTKTFDYKSAQVAGDDDIQQSLKPLEEEVWTNVLERGQCQEFDTKTTSYMAL